MSSEKSLSGDRPIRLPSEDFLGRGRFVDQLERWVQEAPSDEGFVIGVTGPWGCGKSSVLALLRERLQKDMDVVVFDPWLFSNADQLVSRFFDELAAQITGKSKRRVKKLTEQLTGYGAALSQPASVLLGPAGQLAAAPERLRQLRSASASSRRAALRKALAERGRRIVVLLDDIDRLDAGEIREVMRLVKLVADLPGIVHILSYARPRVEAALTAGTEEDGADYLQKIVQANLSVPPVPRERIRLEFTDALGQALGNNLTAWDEQAWDDVFDHGIDAYLKTLRDVKRLVNMVPAAVRICADEVASMDVIALEAIRVFDPTIHEKLTEVADLLTGSNALRSLIGPRTDRERTTRESMEQLLEGSRWPDITTSVVASLFPAVSDALDRPSRHRPGDALTLKRVSARPVLMRYLHHTLASGEVPSKLVDEAVELLGDADGFETLLARITDAEISDLLARVSVRHREAIAIDVVGVADALLRHAGRITPRGPMDFAPERLARQLIEALVIEIADEDARRAAAEQITVDAPTLSFRAMMLAAFRADGADAAKSVGLRLFDATTLRRLVTDLSGAVEAASADDLAGEHYLLWLLHDVRDISGQEAVLRLFQTSPVLSATLTQVGTTVRPMGEFGISLNLDKLVELAGPEVVPLLHRLAAGSELNDDLRQALAESLARLESDI